ncbi:LTA synthase family protein [Ruminococcus sp.]
MEEKNNVSMEKLVAKKGGVFKKIKGWFTSPNGMQTVRFFSGICCIVIGSIIFVLLRSYTTERFIFSFALDFTLMFSFAEFFIMTGRLKKSETKGFIDPFTAAFMLGLNSYFLPDFVMGSYFPKSNVLYILLGILLCWLLYLIGAVIFPKPHAWFCGVNVIFAIYALAQYYVTEFRGNPVQFADLANIKSASEINGMYSLFLDSNVIFVLCDLILIIAVTVTTKVRKIKIRSRIISGAAVIAGCFVFVYSGRFAYDLGIKNRYIRLNFSGAENADTYRCVGYDLMFCFDGMFDRVTKPDGYSTQKAEEILDQYETADTNKKPAIIAIMNESFADFEHIAQFKTNKDYLPNYHKLQEESISGYVSVSAYGGYSCNSEYEFLTGNTLGFLPSGSAVFTQYLNNKQNGLVSWLNELGYTTQAISPCSEGLWDIGNAYEQLQFKSKLFNCGDYISNCEYINDNMSDSSLFHYIEAQYESNKAVPYFVWTATMQNHGPYDDISTVPAEITFEDYNNPEALQYLNSIYQSDKALGELIDYFRDKDEEVIIVMFGDHYPHILSFTEYLYGKDVALLSTEDYSRLRQTPFLIWSNKGVEAEKIDDISLNYLSNKVMEAAGLPKSRYQQELDKIRCDIPIISSYGYKTADGEWYSINDVAEKYEDTLNEYETVQYYRMFDEKRDNSIN